MLDTGQFWIFMTTIASHSVSYLLLFIAMQYIIDVTSLIMIPLLVGAFLLRCALGLINWWQLGFGFTNVLLLLASIVLWTGFTALLTWLNLSDLRGGWLRAPWNYVASVSLVLLLAGLSSIPKWILLSSWLT